MKEVEGEELRAPKVLRAPKAPTSREIEEHEATGHAVFRSWCGHCVRAKGLHERHHAVPQEEKDEKGIPTISIDYFWFGKEGDPAREAELPNLQVKDEHSGMFWTCLVPAKGEDPFAANTVLNCINETGYNRIILKSDNENSIKSLKEKVKSASSCEIILEESKTGDKPSSGAVEAAVRETKRQCRAMKSALQEKLGTEVDDRHPLLTWLGRHSNFLISRYRIGSDGRTAYERLKGKKWRRPMVTFGERVWFRPLKSYSKDKNDLALKMQEGIFLGVHGRNGDILAMTAEGVLKGGSVKRMAPEQRWSTKDFEKMKGTPWKLRPRTPEDVDAVPVPIALPVAEGRLMPEPANKDAGPPRNMYVTRKDVEGNYTLGCPGCLAIQTDMPARSHSAECRTLVQNRLMNSEEGRARIEKAKKRKEEAVAAPEVQAEGGGEALPPVLEDVPDMGEEVHAPDAVGQPSERVDPVGRPSRGEVRTAEGAAGSVPKRARLESKGQKRVGSSVDDLYQEEAPAAPSSSASSGARKEETPADPGGASEMSADNLELITATIANLELASFLQENMYQDASFSECREISKGLLHLGISKSHVAEIYNPKRFTSKANQFGLQPGFAIDLEVVKNKNGEHWDLSREEDQKELESLLDKEKPEYLLGSPPCEAFSPLQNLSKGKRSEEENEAILERGRKHLRIAVKSYWRQLEEGRHFLHEHPKPAASWKEPEVMALMNDERVFTVQGPMCRWNMTAEDGIGKGFVRKETQYLTSSPELAKVLSGQCSGGHRHVHLVNGRAKMAQVYPTKMVSGILRAIRKELAEKGEFNELSVEGVGPVPDDTTNEPENKWETPAEEDGKAIYFDSVSGAPLETEKVLEARKEELKWVQKQQIYIPVDESECWSVTGKAPITLKWVDRNKGDAKHTNYRSRLVVREVKKAGQALLDHELHSSMPPLEALKVLCSLMTSMRKSPRGLPLKMKLLDISRAHFYGESRRSVYCNLPEGDEQAGKCARLVRTIYGTQDASSVWQDTYTELLKSHNISNGRAWPALFYDPATDARFLVHGDDFVILADEIGQKKIEKILAEKFEFRIDGSLGPEEQDGTVMTVLNRILEFDKEKGILRYEADPRHAEMIVKQLSLDGPGVKPVATPGEKQKGEDALKEFPTLDPERSKLYRSLVMRAAYLSLDRADLCEAVKTLARSMSSPTEDSWQRLKRLGRYLRGAIRVVPCMGRSEPSQTQTMLDA